MIRELPQSVRVGVCAALTAWLGVGLAGARGHEFAIRVETGAATRRNTPVAVKLPGRVAEGVRETAKGAWIGGTVDGQSVRYPAQFERTDDGVVLRFVLRRAEAGRTLDLRLHTHGPESAGPVFSFDDRSVEYVDLRLGDNGVLRYMNARDEARHFETYKVYHHIFGYHDEPFITKGPVPTYPHHRGMFIGWNHTRIGDQEVDFWHMKPKGTIQKHRGFASNELAGAVVGRRTALIDWITPDGRTVIEERRTVAAFWQPAAQSLFDVDIELRSRAGRIRLEGDPQHAGFQVRADQEVFENQKETVYTVPEGSDYKKNVTATGPWVASTFKVKGHPYAVMYFSHPSNPHRDTAVMSTRQYARFGEYFATDLIEGRPLHLKYRVIVMDTDRHGVLSTPRVQSKFEDYITPVKVSFP